ncbi:hypothetical protein ABL78_3250 [Leptomonas seymouri]|uniref:Uncharacterized protein n=1 Tax=Leptomonas seymouri TaxID=5684 RepID=A0A0N1HY62_LEPSE|nr:hypothetical protein ABL78_3250 [Leptomonas seymouri]|eukprot:KPI87652.1 hypothetical protein ABL78_3250 [Leptomonas seymouri]
MKLRRVLENFRWLGIRRRTPSFACVSPRRFCVVLSAPQVTPASPVLHTTLAAAHLHASRLLAELLSTRPPTSFAEYVQVTQEWWRAVEQLVLLPCAAEEISDLPQYLVDCAGVRRQRRSGIGTLKEVQDEEAALLEKWEEWVWTSIPSTMPTAATFSEIISGDGGGAHHPLARHEVMSFPQLTSLLYSYSRYHRGVRWGAARHANNNDRNGVGDPARDDGAAAAAYYRRQYRLHPWHGLCCPEGTAQQMPYVHVLRWMLAGKESKASPEELWGQHKALERFHVSPGTVSPFRALDVCSQSGYVTDLLLRAGADIVVAADADLHALGNTEATYHEHVRDGRSKRRGQVLMTRRCDLLPMPRKIEEAAVSRKLQEAQLNHESDSADTTSATAAERRRRRARNDGRGYNGVRPGAQSVAGEAASSLAGLRPCADGSPFQVVYIHPPTPTTAWPVVPAHAQPSLHGTSWWQSLVRRAAEDGVPPQLILPFLPCDAFPAAGRRNPLATLSGLRRTIEALRSDVTERSPTSLPNSSGSGRSISGEEPQGSNGSDALLSDDGYVVLVLPRTYDVDLLMREGEQRNSPSLADWVVAQLDGYYDLVLRRRCLVHPTSSTSSAMQLNAFEEALVTYPHRLQHFKEQGGDDKSALLGDASCVGAAVDMTQWKEQLTRLYRDAWWQDVLVLRKNLTMMRRCAAARQDSRPLLQHRLSLMRKAQKDVAWEDSFEYNEYHPRDTAQHTSHHWTDLIPTYSYLEADFYEQPSAVQRNFLALGHQPATPASTGYIVPSPQDSVAAHEKDDGVAAASEQAAVGFHTLFAQELRTRRRSKLRKLALSPLEQQEWYIDDKLIRSSGARVELMNELSRWDLKDYDS